MPLHTIICRASEINQREEQKQGFILKEKDCKRLRQEVTGIPVELLKIYFLLGLHLPAMHEGKAKRDEICRNAAARKTALRMIALMFSTGYY